MGFCGMVNVYIICTLVMVGTIWKMRCVYNCDVKVCILSVTQCELYHWIDVLNRFDEILEAAAVQQDDSAMRDETTPPQTECIFLCPQLDNPEVKNNVTELYECCNM